MALSNAQLSELLARAAEDEATGSNREKALTRAARGAYDWPEEASDLVEAGRSVTELRTVGPWVGRVIDAWLSAGDAVEVPEPPELRRGFLTRARARAVVAAHPEWSGELRADLQMHTTHSDGKATLVEMAEAGRALGYEHVLVTDHSKGLPIAHGMDEARLMAEVLEIDALNETFDHHGVGFRVLRGMEMNVSPLGEEDMERSALARLDVVLGAFHSKLRERDDQTPRYLAALRNPSFHVLAHPRGRRFGARLGLRAEWPRVFEEAVRHGKAVEIDAHPDRQDLDVELLELAREAGVWVSIGTDAHSVRELGAMELGLAAAILAGIPRERILNFLPADDLRAWARHPR
jgi:histidinol phosphatase-like PHP family hydrolase